MAVIGQVEKRASKIFADAEGSLPKGVFHRWWFSRIPRNAMSPGDSPTK
jgi:hypothetical protein